jgi:hypothetical protein
VGDSSAQIERQITETRQHIDANLAVLERRAASGARRAARIAVMTAAGLAAAAVVGFAAYRLTRRRSPGVLDFVPDSIRRLPRRFGRALGRRPTVKVIVADAPESRRPNPWRSTAQKVASTLAVSAAGALASRIFASGGRPGHSQRK